MNDFTDKQLKNIAYFRTNLTEFLNNELLRNKYLVIVNEKIQNSFDTIELAVNYAITTGLLPGEFIIQQVINEDEVVNFVKAAIY